MGHDVAEGATCETADIQTLMTMTPRGLPTAELRDEHARGPNALAAP